MNFNNKDEQFWIDFMEFLSGNYNFKVARYLELSYAKLTFDIVKNKYEDLTKSKIDYFDIIKFVSKMKGEMNHYMTPPFKTAKKEEYQCDISKYFSI